MGGNQVEFKNPGNSSEDGIIQQRSFRKIHVFGESAQDLIEFAIVLPLLLLVFFGVLDLGRLFHAGITITNAARTGARYAARFSDKPESDIITAVQNEAVATSIDLSSTPISVTCPDSATSWPCSAGEAVRVTITYDFDLIFSGLLNLSSIQLVRNHDMVVQ